VSCGSALSVKRSGAPCSLILRTWFQAFAAKQIGTALFWVVTQRVVVISYRRFGKTCRFHLQAPRIWKKTGMGSRSRNKPPERPSFGFVTDEERTNRLSRNVCKKSPQFVAYWPRRVQFSSLIRSFGIFYTNLVTNYVIFISFQSRTLQNFKAWYQVTLLPLTLQKFALQQTSLTSKNWKKCRVAPDFVKFHSDGCHPVLLSDITKKKKTNFSPLRTETCG